MRIFWSEADVLLAEVACKSFGVLLLCGTLALRTTIVYMQ